jgi:hypothetical protein
LEEAVFFIEAVSQNLPAWMEEQDEKSQYGQPFSGLDSYPSPFEYKFRSSLVDKAIGFK